MKRKTGDYSIFVEHPRYGRGPRFTNVRTRDIPFGYRLTAYISQNQIPGTAIAADLERQAPSPVPVLYYFDLERTCVECDRRFIFFAEEQKYWYETLGFVLDADCVRCVDCRREEHRLEHLRRRYEELFHRDDRTIDETFEMAKCSLALIECGDFHSQQTQRVRMLLNAIPNDRGQLIERRRMSLRRRVAEIEAKNFEAPPPPPTPATDLDSQGKTSAPSE